MTTFRPTSGATRRPPELGARPSFSRWVSEAAHEARPSLVSLKSGDTEGHLIRSLDDFSRGRPDSSSQIFDHSSGERRSFNASLSNLSRGRESFEDVADIIHPIVVRLN